MWQSLDAFPFYGDVGGVATSYLPVDDILQAMVEESICKALYLLVIFNRHAFPSVGQCVEVLACCRLSVAFCPIVCLVSLWLIGEENVAVAPGAVVGNRIE